MHLFSVAKGEQWELPGKHLGDTPRPPTRGSLTEMLRPKALARSFAETLVANDFIWTAISRTLVRGSQFLCSVRDIHEANRIVDRNPGLREAFAPRIVLDGPFKGMKYGNTRAFCSALTPKLLGTYELELRQVIQKALARKYETLVDVGAADGYYAVGFCLGDPDIRVIAYEQDQRGQAQFYKLAGLNGVADRIDLRGKCEPSDLLSLDARPGLLIVDCEGYEEILLNPEVIQHLERWDFLIETHDGISPEITRRLASRFSHTHHTTSIETIHDLDKADHVDLPLLENVRRREVDRLLAESREHACLRWLVCSSKSQATSI